MTDSGASSRPETAGGTDKALFAVQPKPDEIFAKRAARLRKLAGGHELEPYLLFAADICEAQHGVVRILPQPLLPENDRLGRAFAHGMPPLAKATFEPLEEVSQTVLEFFKQIRGLAVPAEAEAASASFSEAPSGMRIEAIRDALQDTPPENIPQRVLILAALQVHFSMMAAQLNAADLNPAGDGICPVCGSPPLASAVVGWPGAHGARFCTCALCGTMWNAVRVKCVFCGSTEGISYLSIEERPETLKAETCEKCGSYLKIFYQVKDHLLEPCADDIASLDLDMMLTEAGWRRGGNNPFLLGY